MNGTPPAVMLCTDIVLTDRERVILTKSTKPNWFEFAFEWINEDYREYILSCERWNTCENPTENIHQRDFRDKTPGRYCIAVYSVVLFLFFFFTNNLRCLFFSD